MNNDLNLELLQQLPVPETEQGLCWWTCTVSCEATSAVNQIPE